MLMVLLREQLLRCRYLQLEDMIFATILMMVGIKTWKATMHTRQDGATKQVNWLMT